MEGNDSIDNTTANVCEDDDVIPSFLNTSEDPGNGTKTEEEASYSRKLSSMTITEVGYDLDQFTWRRIKTYFIKQRGRHFKTSLNTGNLTGFPIEILACNYFLPISLQILNIIFQSIGQWSHSFKI